MKFLVPIYSCLQNPWLGGYRPQIPVLSVLCPQLNLLNPPTPNKIPGYTTLLNGGQANVQWQRRLKFGPSKTCLKCNSILVYEIIFPIEAGHQSKESNGDAVMGVGRVSKWRRVAKWWNGIQYSDSTIWPKKKSRTAENATACPGHWSNTREVVDYVTWGSGNFRRRVNEDCSLLGYCPEGRA